MSERARRLLGRAWRYANGNTAPKEKFLEDALAAALEADGVWPRLRDHFGWEALPERVPRVSTQDVVEDGRTDVRLAWGGEQSLVLELKIDAAPSERQLERYLQDGSWVAALSRLPAHRDVRADLRPRFLGVETWRRLLDLRWDEAPLVFHQLQGLIEATGVAVRRIREEQLRGLVSSWDAWDVFDQWAWEGTVAVAKVFRSAGFDWVTQEKPRERVRIDASHHRYAYWTWPRPWRAGLGAFAGLFMGRSQPAVQVPGFPDVVLTLHLAPDSQLGRAILLDDQIRAIVETWRARGGSVEREFPAGREGGEVLRARQSTRLLIDEPDQGRCLVDWLRARAQEWVDAGLLHRIAAIESSLPAITASSEPPPG